MPTCASSQQLTQLAQTVKQRLAQLQTAVASLSQCPTPLLQTTEDDPAVPTHDILFGSNSLNILGVYSVEIKKDITSISGLTMRLQYTYNPTGMTTEPPLCVWPHGVNTWQVTEAEVQPTTSVKFTLTHAQGYWQLTDTNGHKSQLSATNTLGPFGTPGNMSTTVAAKAGWLRTLLKNGASWKKETKSNTSQKKAPDTITLVSKSVLNSSDELSWILLFKWASGETITATGPTIASIRTGTIDDQGNPSPDTCYFPDHDDNFKNVFLNNYFVEDSRIGAGYYANGASSLYYQCGPGGTESKNINNGVVVFVVNQTPYALPASQPTQELRAPSYLKYVKDTTGVWHMYLYSNLFSEPIQYDLVP